MSIAPNNYPAYGSAFRFASEVPLHARPNKSGSGTHQTTITAQGRIFDCRVEYTCKHTPSLDDYEIELGTTVEVYSVNLQWRKNGVNDPVTSAIDFNQRQACRHCDWILNEFEEVEDRIVQEIRDSLN
jgi:hypothetical protein